MADDCAWYVEAEKKCCIPLLMRELNLTSEMLALIHHELSTKFNLPGAKK